MTTSSVTGAHRPPQGVFMPTRDQLIAAYSSIITAAKEAGTMKHLAHAPANASKYPSYPILTMQLGINQQAFVIKNELYLKSTFFTRNPQTTSWYKVGPAPLF